MKLIDISIIVLSTSFLVATFTITGQQHMLAGSKKQPFRSLKSDEMTVHWTLDQHTITFTVTAPTDGWIALGINTKPELIGTNLIMGAAEYDFYRMEDQYIVALEKHPSILKLGGEEAPLFRHVTEENGTTTMKVTLPKPAVDQFHFDLMEGNTYYLLLAWSESDDFQHHSHYRTFKKITL